VIPQAEILALRGEWGLRDSVIEKDYVLGWLLAAIANDPDLREDWVFKGGTCLRKCYYETYRFSEDLDFTVVNGGAEEPDALLPILSRLGDWLGERSGIEITVDPGSIRRGQNRRGNPTTALRIAYRGPSTPPNLPRVKVDLTSDELVAISVQHASILHPYSDADQVTGEVTAYSLEELFAEKIRALAERCRPRDLYDVISIHRHSELIGDPALVHDALTRKCEYVGIDLPTTESVLQSPYRQELDQEWANMLAHQLPHLPDPGEYWAAIEAVFDWLAGTPAVVLPRAEGRQRLDQLWSPPRSMASWGGRPLDLIRYAGANRLKVELDYRAEMGRWGWRRVEPYALRQTLEGNVVLFVVNDRGELRSYRTDRIGGARVTDEAFVPRYVVEF